MRLACAVVVVVALASAGCVGSSSSSTSNGGSDDLGLTPLKTDLVITYTVSKSKCPPGAFCGFVRNDHRIVRRHLTCSPDGGDYEDPTAVCRALTDLVTKLKQPHGLCDCPPQPSGYRAPKVVGIYQGKRRTILLDGCSLCGVPDGLADAAMLLPVS